MRNLLLCLAMFIFVGNTKAADEIQILPVTETKCHIEKQYLGVYLRECPFNALVTGVDVRVGAGNYLWTYVRCERRELICKEEILED